MLFEPALCYRNPKQHTVMRQNAKATQYLLAFLRVVFEEPSIRMAEKNEAHHIVSE